MKICELNDFKKCTCYGWFCKKKVFIIQLYFLMMYIKHISKLIINNEYKKTRININTNFQVYFKTIISF